MILGAIGLVSVLKLEPKYLRVPFLVDTRAGSCSWLLVYMYLCHCYSLAYGQRLGTVLARSKYAWD